MTKIEDEIIEKTKTILGGFPLFLYDSREIASAFKTTLFETLTDKLVLDEENKTTIDDLSFIFNRLDGNFNNLSEREEFYRGIVASIIYVYSNIGNLTGWQIRTSSRNEVLPRIENGTLLTEKSVSNADTALWLFNEYEKMVDKEIKLEEIERTRIIEKVKRKRHTGNRSSCFW